MPDYRRTLVPGGTFFFTVALLDRRLRLLVDHADALRRAFATAHAARPFHVLAIAILPEHLHCVWRLPEGDGDNATRWRHIKREFSRAVAPCEIRTRSRELRRERGVWQRRFWARVITDERDLRAHVDYVHFNPVKHGHASSAADWPLSSFHRYVRRGDLPRNWGVRDP